MIERKNKKMNAHANDFSGIVVLDFVDGWKKKNARITK